VTRRRRFSIALSLGGLVGALTHSRKAAKTQSNAKSTKSTKMGLCSWSIFAALREIALPLVRGDWFYGKARARSASMVEAAGGGRGFPGEGFR
jgi:hypothetical protein